MVERQLPKLNVEGSSPFSRSISLALNRLGTICSMKKLMQQALALPLLLFAVFATSPAVIAQEVKGLDEYAQSLLDAARAGDAHAGTATQVMFSRVGGELRAMNAICPHEGILMNDGPITPEGNIVCPMHLFEFDTKTGREKGTQCKNVKIYKVREDGNDADIWL